MEVAAYIVLALAAALVGYKIGHSKASKEAIDNVGGSGGSGNPDQNHK